ncbi:Fc receptor-like protein 5 [Xenopus laevis]|uniref:Fc receptor-like protein 5 n=1 Tax=Xenopus laevis TaxID=8355 RepID=A0A8J1LPM4_XENLA|nr:Fc receptor-like protein 5 [Xenopus laevis]
MDTAGAAVRPVISFSPNWNPIFSGESVTLTCNVTPTAQGNLRYSWYREGHQIPGDQQSLAGVIHSGDYECEADDSERSEYVGLEVSADMLILQVPLAVHKGDLYEGDSLSLRCHSWPGYRAKDPVFYKDYKIIESPVKLFSLPQIEVRPDQDIEGDHMTITCDTKLSPRRANTELRFAFYRNGHNVQGFSLSNQYGVPSAQLEDSGNYTCDVQTLTGSVRKRSNVTHIQIQELFSWPQIKQSEYPVNRGENMTITCDTDLSPHRETTELQFAFYRNGHNVQGFSSSNQYGVPSAQLEDSGNYTCEVQTPTGSVRKRSNMFTIQKEGSLQNTVRLALSAVIFIIILLIVFYHIKTMEVTYSQETKKNEREIRNEGECTMKMLLIKSLKIEPGIFL